MRQGDPQHPARSRSMAMERPIAAHSTQVVHGICEEEEEEEQHISPSGDVQLVLSRGKLKDLAQGLCAMQWAGFVVCGASTCLV